MGGSLADPCDPAPAASVRSIKSTPLGERRERRVVQCKDCGSSFYLNPGKAHRHCKNCYAAWARRFREKPSRRGTATSPTSSRESSDAAEDVAAAQQPKKVAEAAEADDAEQPRIHPLLLHDLDRVIMRVPD